VIREHFKDFKPKGKGHEYEDLDAVMKRMEHWAHRFYPKLPFDSVAEKVEFLGRKAMVKTYVKKLRMGMDDGTGEDGVVKEDNEGGGVADAAAGGEGAMDETARCVLFMRKQIRTQGINLKNTLNYVPFNLHRHH
jgi:hypothetical protein